MCVWWTEYQSLISIQWLADLFALGWLVLLLAARCQDEGADSWWGQWMWACMGKRIVCWFCSSEFLGVCVSLSQMYCRGNRPCFVEDGGEVGVWGCHSTYSCSNSNVQTFRPGAKAPSSLWVPRHRLFLSHTYWCYLNQSSYFAKWPPSEGCVCIAEVSACFYVWIYNCTWMQQWFDLAELEGLNII